MLGIRYINKVAIDLFQGNLTEFVCDAMVNPTDNCLAGTGGVDEAIRRIGGPGIASQCAKIGSLPAGEAVVTSAGNLPAEWVIHTVGPIWSNGANNEEELLKEAYYNCLVKAGELAVRHVALPSISTGGGGFPISRAAKLAMQAVMTYVVNAPSRSRSLERITFVLFNGDDYNIFQDALFETFSENDV